MWPLVAFESSCSQSFRSGFAGWATASAMTDTARLVMQQISRKDFVEDNEPIFILGQDGLTRIVKESTADEDNTD